MNVSLDQTQKTIFRILLVEDNMHVVRTIKNICAFYSPNKYDLTVLRYGIEVLDFLSHPQTKIDLVLLDLDLPGPLDGFEVLKKIRKLDAPIAKIPVIACTGNDSNLSRDRLQASGFDEVITKPFDAHVLTSKLEAQLKIN